MIEANKDNPKSVYCFTSLFFDKLREEGFQAVQKFTTRVDIFSYTNIVFAVAHEDHWSITIAVRMNLLCDDIADFNSATQNQPCFAFIDSLKLHNSAFILSYLKQYLSNELEVKRGKRISFDNVKVVTCSNLIRQIDGYSCGDNAIRNLKAFLQIPSSTMEDIRQSFRNYLTSTDGHETNEWRQGEKVSLLAMRLKSLIPCQQKCLSRSSTVCNQLDVAKDVDESEIERLKPGLERCLAYANTDSSTPEFFLAGFVDRKEQFLFVYDGYNWRLLEDRNIDERIRNGWILLLEDRISNSMIPARDSHSCCCCCLDDFDEGEEAFCVKGFRSRPLCEKCLIEVSFHPLLNPLCPRCVQTIGKR
jgi:hypothetical protein